MENMAINGQFWKDKRVFITGHTGFKGGWLALWLQKMGANVTGYALSPPTDPNFFTAAGIGDKVHSIIADIRDGSQLRKAIQLSQPELVFHLAAQPLVRESYIDPVNTFETNVMGTVRFLDAIQNVSSIRACIVVTSDKCYHNPVGSSAHVENDPLGGHSAYASSKACTELVTDAYRHSFFDKSDIAVATVRAGNVIGGGDWAKDRLIPDMVKAFDRGEELLLRYPDAVRPWQHVLDPLLGYLQLAECLYLLGKEYGHAWNFGPQDNFSWCVKDIAKLAATCWEGEARWKITAEKQPHEDHILRIDSTLANEKLNWTPKLDIKTALTWTFEWYQMYSRQPEHMHGFSLNQIEQFESSVGVVEV